jgi:hypothetical protein
MQHLTDLKNFDDPKLANEVVKAVYSIQKAPRPSIYAAVEISYRPSGKIPTIEEINQTIDQCRNLGLIKAENDSLERPEGNSLYDTLRHLLEKKVRVYEARMNVQKAASLTKRIYTHRTLVRNHDLFTNYLWKDGIFFVKSVGELPRSIKKMVKPTSVKTMTDEQLFEYAYGMYPLLSTAIIGLPESRE